jgi:hypothetical protein
MESSRQLIKSNEDLTVFDELKFNNKHENIDLKKYSPSRVFINKPKFK